VTRREHNVGSNQGSSTEMIECHKIRKSMLDCVMSSNNQISFRLETKCRVRKVRIGHFEAL